MELFPSEMSPIPYYNHPYIQEGNNYCKKHGKETITPYKGLRKKKKTQTQDDVYFPRQASRQSTSIAPLKSTEMWLYQGNLKGASPDLDTVKINNCRKTVLKFLYVGH